MKKELIVSIIVLVLAGSATLWFISSSSAKTVDLKNEIKDNSKKMDSFMAKPLPRSLDEWYPNEPIFQPIYMFKMFELGGSMMGVMVNTLQDDTTNAKIAYQIFSDEYMKSSKMVPEWEKYYDLKAVKKVGDALEAGDKEKTLANLEVVFQTCGSCHTAMKTRVFAKYHWNDFNTVKMRTTNPEQPETSWKEAKAKYLVTGFDGTIINAKENQQEETYESFQQFKAMFQFMKEACSSCHDTDRKYYVSDDITALISTAEDQINTGDLENTIVTMEQIGGSCYACHNTHEPLQRLKESVSHK